MFIICGRGNLAAAFYLGKKLSLVQVESGAKTGVFPARHLFFQDIKKTDGGFRKSFSIYKKERMRYNVTLLKHTVSKCFISATR